MLSHVSRSIGRALPGGVAGIGVDFLMVNILQVVLVARTGNSDSPTIRDYACPAGTRSVYIQCWGHGSVDSGGGGGGAWAADMLDAAQGDVVRTSMPSRGDNTAKLPTQAILNGVTVRAAFASGTLGGRAEDSVGRWIFSGGNGGISGGGPTGGASGTGRGGGAAGGHFTPGGNGVEAGAPGLTPGGGSVNVTPGQSQIVLVFLGDPI